MIFNLKGMNTINYEQAIKDLENAGEGMPEGRLYHMAFSTNAGFRVIDVWESEELFKKFGRTLMPIMQKFNIDPGKPEFHEIHNIIKG